MGLARMTIHVESCQKIQETILCDVCVASRKRYPGYRGETPVTTSPPRKPCRICRESGGEQRGKRPFPHLLTCFYPAKQKDSPADCPFSLPLVVGGVNAALQHGNQERVSLDLGRVLGQLMGLVKAVSVAAPIDIIFLCRLLALCLCGLNLGRDFATDSLLTGSHGIVTSFREELPAILGPNIGPQMAVTLTGLLRRASLGAASIGRRPARFFAHSVSAGCPALFFAATMRRL